MPLLGICLTLAAAAAAGSAPVFIAAPRFTLAWTHSIELQRWEEDYQIEPGAAPGSAPVLRAREARIRGSGAGMEPPAHARLQAGWYHYQPPAYPQTPLRLTRSEFSADFELCIAGRCQSMGQWLASDGGVTLLAPCSKA